MIQTTNIDGLIRQSLGTALRYHVAQERILHLNNTYLNHIN